MKQLKKEVDDYKSQCETLKKEKATLKAELESTSAENAKNTEIIERLLEENSSLIDSQGIQRKAPKNEQIECRGA